MNNTAPVVLNNKTQQEPAMPKLIKDLTELMNSLRFKKATNYRTYTDEEINTIQTFVDKVGFREAIKSYNQFCTLVTYDLADLAERYQYLKTTKDNTSEQTHVARFGKVEGLIRYKVYGEKQRQSNSFEYKKIKHGWTKEQFDEFNKSRSVTYELCVARHGLEKGQEIWNTYVERQCYTNSIEYFKEKYSDDGYEKWLEYNREKAKGSKIEWIMEKYNVGIDQALDILSSRHPKSHSSIAEMTFIDSLEKSLGYQIKYTARTKQFCIWNADLNTPCFYDVADSKLFKIIEFHGDYWHCNPVKYSANYVHPHSGCTAKELWHRDYLKIKTATDRGFQVKIVWWSEFENSPQQVIEECVKWWTT